MRRGAGPRRAARSGGASGNRDPHRHQAGAHFIADVPPMPLVERMAKTFRDTGGDLKEVARTMISSRRSLDASRRRNSSGRANGWSAWCAQPGSRRPTLPLYRWTSPARRAAVASPSPKGFPDDEPSWIDGMGPAARRRQQFRRARGRYARSAGDYRECAGFVVSAPVKQAVGRAESRQQALALLFMSAEFQRR